MKPIDVKDYKNIDSNKEANDEDPKFQVVNDINGEEIIEKNCKKQIKKI